MKTLVILCGPPASGKSTYARVNSGPNDVIISRDVIRYALINGDVNNYFSREDEVFEQYVNEINSCLSMYNIETVYADASQLTEKSRNKLLDKLSLNISLNNVEIIAVNFLDGFETCLRRNSLREGFANVPRGAIRRMCAQFVPAEKGEKYDYDKIINMKNGYRI